MKRLKEKKGIKLIAGALPLVMLFLFLPSNLNAVEDECLDAAIKCALDHSAAVGAFLLSGRYIIALAIAARGAEFCYNGYWFCKKYWTETK